MAVIDLLMIGLGIDTRRLRDGERALGRLQQAGNKAENALGRMASMLASAFAVSKIIEYADAYTNLQNRLKLVTDSTEALGQATQNVIDIAQNSRQALGATGDLYFKISQNADKLGLSVADVTRVTETFGKTLALSGAGTQQAEAAILQFSQALASGVFRGDEFNSVAENAPAAMDAFSRALGVTKGELRKLAHDGALTADILIQALKEQSAAVDESFSKTESTISQAFTDLKNSAIIFTGRINESTEAGKGFVSIMSKASDFMDSLDIDENAKRIGDAFGYAYKAALFFAGIKLTGFVSGMALSLAATLKTLAAEEALRIETLALTTANNAATGVAVRRAAAEKVLALEELGRARATSATVLATLNATVADAERAAMDARLAAGTQYATAAELQRQIALDRVALAQQAVVVSANTEAAAVSRATLAAEANTVATTAQTIAQAELAAATNAANVANRAATGIVAGLGGPLGAAITLLGVAATAWFVFGDNAEKAADKSKEAIDKINKNLTVSDDELQILAKSLSVVESQIQSTMESSRSASLSSNERIKASIQSDLDKLIAQKKTLESAIETATFNRTVDDLLANPAESGVAKAMLEASRKKAEADKIAKKSADDATKKAEQLKSQYDALSLSQLEQIQLWGKDTGLAKLNFDLKYTNLSKLGQKEKDNLILQQKKIDALQAEKDLAAQQTEVDSFMAGQAQELDALRAQYTSKNEIVYQSMKARQAIIDEAYATDRMSETEFYTRSTQNDLQYNAEKLQIQSDAMAEQNALKNEEFNAASNLAGNILELARATGHENNDIAKVAFVAQKAIAIAQAILMTEQAALATQASYAMMAVMNPLAAPALLAAGTAHAMVMRGLGYASVAIMAATAGVELAGARAMGGNVQGGKSYLVGERGAEVITMGGNGHVTPNHKLGGGDSKITIVNQTTGRIDSVEEKTMPDGERILIIQQARDLIAAEMRDPNSKTSRSMQSSLTVQRRR